MRDETGKSSAGRNRWRCFWAALLERESEHRLAAAVAQLRGRGHQGLRWIPRANWHLTLHFLGSIDASRIDAFCAALQARPLAAPLSLVLRGIGPFPCARPRTLAALMDSSPELSDWVRYLRACDAAAEPNDESSEFRAHLTVARPRRGRRGRYPELELGDHLSFDRIALVRSDTKPSGAVYESLAVQTAAITAPGSYSR